MDELDQRPPAACRVPPGGRAPLPEIDLSNWGLRRRRALRRAATARRADRTEPRSASVLLLDMGGVVIPTLFESVALAGFPEGPLDNDSEYARVQSGELGELDYWAALARDRPDLDIPGLWRRCSYVRDELRRALAAIATNVRLAAFTNDMEHWFGAGWEQGFPELTAFDAIVEASKLGVHKPDPEAFRQAAGALGERPDRCLFVDDLAPNLDGAASVGMHTRLFDVRDPEGSIAEVLADLDLDPVIPQPRRAFSAPREQLATLGDDGAAGVEYTRFGGRGARVFRPSRGLGG